RTAVPPHASQRNGNGRPEAAAHPIEQHSGGRMDKADRAGFALFCAAIIFLAFVGGAFVVLSKSFPYSYFNDAYKAAQATLGQLTATDLHTETHLWREARRADRGVTLKNA